MVLPAFAFSQKLMLSIGRILLRYHNVLPKSVACHQFCKQRMSGLNLDLSEVHHCEIGPHIESVIKSCMIC